jgi:hypothetical protein
MLLMTDTEKRAIELLHSCLNLLNLRLEESRDYNNPSIRILIVMTREFLENVNKQEAKKLKCTHHFDDNYIEQGKPVCVYCWIPQY